MTAKMISDASKPTVEQRLDPKSKHFDPELLRLRKAAYPHLYPKEPVRCELTKRTFSQRAF